MQNRRFATEAHPSFVEIAIIVFAMSLSFSLVLDKEIQVWPTRNMNKTDLYSYILCQPLVEQSKILFVPP